MSFKISTSSDCGKPQTSSCNKCLQAIALDQRINLIRDEYLKSNEPWVIGFSGGKDSTATLKLVFAALKRVDKFHQPVSVVYCDTGVEIPVMRDLVYSALNSIQLYGNTKKIPIDICIAEPRLEDRYFVKVIGRGYPSPTNKFRWCTDRLRIDPIQRLLKSLMVSRATVIVGTRYGESNERDRILQRNETSEDYFYRQTGRSNIQLYAPIVDFDVSDVWSTIFTLKEPELAGGDKLLKLYREAGAECPIVRDAHGSPCGSGRFGCWTCTVVRKDKSVTSLVEQGHKQMLPLLKFRDWLAKYRDRPESRCSQRRNGAVGPGPFTLNARKSILRRLRIAQKLSGITLIKDEEIREIHRLWRDDRKSENYVE